MRWDLFAIMMLLPWLATFGGSLMAARIRVNAQKGQGPLLGFAAGVMVAASVLSLIHISPVQEPWLCSSGAMNGGIEAG